MGYFGKKEVRHYGLPSPFGIEIEENKMAIYANNARGIGLDSRHTKIDESQIKTDFIVAYGGSGETLDGTFTSHVQQAYDLKIPVIMIWQLDYSFYANANITHWNPTDPENEYNIRGIKSALFSGTAKRAISGLMLDITANKDSLGNTITQTWVQEISEYIFENAYNLFKLPEYIYFTPAFVASYKTAPNLDAFITKSDSVASWQSATPGANTQMASWSNIPIPPDTYKPFYGYSNPHVWLTKYANTAYTFAGIQASDNTYPSVPLWQYMSTPAGLYSDLNFVSSGSVTPTPNPNPTPTPVVSGSGVDLTPVLNAISGLSTQMTNLENRINGIFK
jgi:hypothetical protein